MELDPAAVMQIVAERTQKMSGADGAVIDLIEGDEAVHRAATGIAKGCVGRRLKLASSLTGHAVRERAVLRCDDTESDSRVDRDACREMETRSMVVAPLIQDDGAVGLLRVMSRRPGAFDDLHVAAIRLMAGAAAAALRNASEMAAKERLLSERGAALAALAESEQRFRLSFDHAPIGMAIVAPNGEWIRVNQSLCEIVGYSEAELLATTFQAITHPDDLQDDLENVRQLLAGEQRSYKMFKRYLHKLGHVVWTSLGVSLVRDAAGQPLHFISQIQDISDLRRNEHLEEDRGAVLEMVAQDQPLNDVLVRLTQMMERQIPGGIASVMLLHDGVMQNIGPRLAQPFAEALRPMAVSFVANLCSARSGDSPPIISSDLATSDSWRPLWEAARHAGFRGCWSLPVRTPDQSFLAMLNLYTSAVREPTNDEAKALDAAGKLAVVAIEHFQITRQLSHLARHDALTGLPNRIVFEDRLQQAIAIARRDRHMVGLLVIDLDHFKAVNDSLGHQAGDALLQQFARRVQCTLRRSDTLARLGGDEFVLVLPKMSVPDDATEVARKLVELLNRPFEIAGYQLNVTGSIGVSVYPADGEDPSALQQAADAAMYYVKRQTRNGFAIATPGKSV